MTLAVSGFEPVSLHNDCGAPPKLQVYHPSSADPALEAKEPCNADAKSHDASNSCRCDHFVWDGQWFNSRDVLAGSLVNNVISYHCFRLGVIIACAISPGFWSSRSVRVRISRVTMEVTGTDCP